ncbi:MAG TPA: type II secretion system minor pseudopilin GspK, partial [Rhizobacter sp.]
LDWAGLILKEDARPSSGQVDHLGEPWAVPLAEARLSTFLASDKDNNADDEGPEAFLSGSITDAQSRFNLRNLVDPKFEISKDDLGALRRLCENVNIAVSVADLLANGMKAAYTPAGATTAVADPPLQPKRLSQLTWLGVDAQALARLEPYVVLLPTETPINVNTASREVIAAVIPGFNVGDAERMIQYRQRTPFRKHQDIQQFLPSGTPAERMGKVDIATRYFEVRGRLRLNDRVLEQRSLVERNQRTITVLSSERINSTDRER